MKSTLPATHLLRHYILFTLTLVFLLTMIRSAYGLWQFPKVMEADALIDMFIMGLRFDLALAGGMLLVPVVLGTFLSMFDISRGLAKVLIITWLILCLFVVLATEFITPYFIMKNGLRPDIPLMAELVNPLLVVTQQLAEYSVPVIIGLVLAVLIFVAFWARLETSRMLRYRLARLSGFSLMIFGGAACALAMWSGFDPTVGPLTPGGQGLISTDATVNDIALNSAYKSVYSLVLPYLN